MKALIVDDDQTIVEVIRDTVHWDKLGVQEVFTAYNAQTARNLLLENRIDLILCDIEMPQESGLSLLAWYQAQSMRGKFIILTAHESFAYARQALQLRAADYLLKPFHVDAVELVLQKNIELLEKEDAASHRSDLGQWVIDHLSDLRRSFFESLLRGTIQQNHENIAENIRIRNLDILPDAQFRLATVRITGFEQDQEQYGSDSIQYMYGNMLADTVFGDAKSERVISYDRQDKYLTYIVVCDPEPDEVLLRLFDVFLQRCHELMDATVTCCIGGMVPMSDFRAQRHHLSHCLQNQVSFYGQVFLDHVETADEQEMSPVLKMEQLKTLFESRKQKQLLDEVKREIEARMRSKTLDEKTLRIIRMEYQQAAYAYLADNGIMISYLLKDEELSAAMDAAERSPLDFLRWANILTGKAFSAVEDIEKSKTLVAQIDSFIQEHYAEPIGRNEIGQEFHMVPEYLAKIYKKKTGKTLKDAINEYRVYRARLLLEQSDMRIIDIAMETGFDNASYFSTLFKKYTGHAPADYRKKT